MSTKKEKTSFGATDPKFSRRPSSHPIFSLQPRKMLIFPPPSAASAADSTRIRGGGGECGGGKRGERRKGKQITRFRISSFSRIAAYERVFVHVVSMHFKKASFCILETIVCFSCLIPAQVTSRKLKVVTKKILVSYFFVS